MRRFIRAHDVPYNVLHDRGYPSIGCAKGGSCARPAVMSTPCPEFGRVLRGGRAPPLVCSGGLRCAHGAHRRAGSGSGRRPRLFCRRLSRWRLQPLPGGCAAGCQAHPTALRRPSKQAENALGEHPSAFFAKAPRRKRQKGTKPPSPPAGEASLLALADGSHGSRSGLGGGLLLLLLAGNEGSGGKSEDSDGLHIDLTIV